MAFNSEISWTHHTANLWWGCTEVHEGCTNCYARILDHRWGGDHWGNDAPRRAIESVWKDLANMQRKAAAKGVVERVFVGSMMDIFEKAKAVVNVKDQPLPGDTGLLRQRFFREIVPNSPNLLFLLLTKRPSNIKKYIPEAWLTTPPKNVMYGTSVVNQETFNKLIPQLLEVPGRKFLSMEPLLGPVEFSDVTGRADAISQLGKKALNGIDWIICGGESGPKARPMHPDWARSIRDQCAAADVPFHFKQWGECRSQITPDDNIAVNKEPDLWMNKKGDLLKEEWQAMEDKTGNTWSGYYRFGKTKAGHLLDGKEHQEVPTF